MEDARKELFWHPIHGEVRMAESKNTYVRKDLLKVVISTPLETVYERDRRLWVEQMLIQKIARFGLSLVSFETERWTAELMAQYDRIQDTIFSFNQ